MAAYVEPGVQPGLKPVDVLAVENKFLLARYLERQDGRPVFAAGYPRQ